MRSNSIPPGHYLTRKPRYAPEMRRESPTKGSPCWKVRDIRNTDMTEKVSYLTTEISMPCLSMKFSFSELDSKHFWDDSRQKGSVPSRSQYCGPTGRPPLGSWSRMSSLSSTTPCEFMMERMDGTDERDLSNAAYLGRYTCVWMSTKSFAGRDMT